MGQMPCRHCHDANDVPNFPQDAYMEGPMMAMDEMVDRPENYGLRPGWSGYMQGMMTFVRVLPPDKYDEDHRPDETGQAIQRSLCRYSGARLNARRKMRITDSCISQLPASIGLTALAQSSGSSSPTERLHALHGRHGDAGLPPDRQKQTDPPGLQRDMRVQMESRDTHATTTLQEPENPERKTGSNLPAPEFSGTLLPAASHGLGRFRNSCRSQ